MSRLQKAKIFEDIKIGFDIDTVQLRIDQITPLKLITPAIRESEKYKQIVASIREIGIIEPPVVALTLAKGYITSLLSNARIVRYLAQQHSQMLGEFQKVAEMKTLVTER